MDDSNSVMISALNHYLYCSRRCALVHVEQVWSENLYTMRGNDVHENVHAESSTAVSGIRCECALPLWSHRLGLIGKADLVEFHDGMPIPIEYKAGRCKEFENNLIQLCAQALCLEEMLGVPVPQGALYWHGSRERREVFFTEKMRTEVELVTLAVRTLLEQHRIPLPVNDKRCTACSLKESCMPGVVAERDRSRRAVRELFSIQGGD